MPIRIIRAALAALSLASVTSPAAAYWDYGHRTVAKIAFVSVRPATRAKLSALLRHGDLLGTPDCPVTDMPSASTWADCIKPLKDAAGKSRFGYAYSWHFQDVDVCQPFDLTAPCADGNCVSAQIDRMAARLAERHLPLADRVQALAFLIHFVGDLSQPLHVGEHHDQGANKVKASYGLIAGRTNLHSIWDGYLAERAISTPPGGPLGLLRATSRAERRTMAAGNVTDWSRDSWQVSRDVVYASILGDPCAPAKRERPVMDEAMVERLIPAARVQVVKGGLRLAKLLDAALR